MTQEGRKGVRKPLEGNGWSVTLSCKREETSGHQGYILEKMRKKSPRPAGVLSGRNTMDHKK